jgi:hypothetical protein
MQTVRTIVAAALFVCAAACAAAQEPAAPAPAPSDAQAQYPAFMKNSYFDFNVGSIGYLFNGSELQPGFEAESIDRPRIAVRVDFFGHHFTKHIGAQVTYIRPGAFVAYHNINGNQTTSQTSLAYAGLTFVGTATLGQKWSGYLEGGYGVTSRSGIVLNDATALVPAHYGSAMIGGGFAFHMKPNMDLMLGATYLPGRKSFGEPSTRLYTAGLRYEMRPLTDEQVAETIAAANYFPVNTIRFGVTTNGLGYGTNDFFSRTVPIFWGGNVQTRYGFTLDYQRNVFHTKERFAFDLGVSAGTWTTNLNGQQFRTFSAYPLFRFFLARPEVADIYFSYSLAGPTYIDQTLLDGRETGAAFTFQDFMGVGAYIGHSRRLNAEIGIKHYSNGNLATTNASIMIPLTFTVGVTF